MDLEKLNISFNKDWIKSVSFTEFKKNAIAKMFSPDEQKYLYEKFSGKKVKKKKEEGDN